MCIIYKVFILNRLGLQRFIYSLWYYSYILYSVHQKFFLTLHVSLYLLMYIYVKHEANWDAHSRVFICIFFHPSLRVHLTR